MITMIIMIFFSESESEKESDVSGSDSELSTMDDIFAFESDQSDSDDEMNNAVDRYYVYHDNIEFRRITKC